MISRSEFCALKLRYLDPPTTEDEIVLNVLRHFNNDVISTVIVHVILIEYKSNRIFHSIPTKNREE